MWIVSGGSASEYLRQVSSFIIIHLLFQLLSYIGEYKDDQKTGDGTYFFANGDTYKGLFQANLKNGNGTYTTKNGIVLVGVWENDLMQGNFQVTLPDGRLINCVYKDNVKI